MKNDILTSIYSISNLFKSVIIATIILFFNNTASAQQDPQTTHYLYNTLSVNPAYAGTQDFPELFALARLQWVGFDGAPNTQVLSFNMPVYGVPLGIGVNAMNDRIGPINETYLDANASYSIETNFGAHLSFGMKLGARYFSLDGSKFNTTDVEPDLQGGVSKVLPTVGSGIYFHNERFFVGFSAPNIVPSKYLNRTNRGSNIATESRHYFAMAGGNLDLTHSVRFRPSVLVKGTEGAPIAVDATANFIINNLVHTGVSYRWNDAVNGLIGFQPSDFFFVGYSYDFTLSANRQSNSGTHEIVLKYQFKNSSRKNRKKRLECPKGQIQGGRLKYNSHIPKKK